MYAEDVKFLTARTGTGAGGCFIEKKLCQDWYTFQELRIVSAVARPPMRSGATSRTGGDFDEPLSLSLSLSAVRPSGQFADAIVRAPRPRRCPRHQPPVFDGKDKERAAQRSDGASSRPTRGAVLSANTRLN